MRKRAYYEALKQTYQNTDLTNIKPEFRLKPSHVASVYVVATLCTIIYFILKTPQAGIFFFAMAGSFHWYVFSHTNQKFEIKGDLFVDWKNNKTYNLSEDLRGIGGDAKTIRSRYGNKLGSVHTLKLYFNDGRTFLIKSSNLKNYYKIECKLLAYQTHVWEYK